MRIRGQREIAGKMFGMFISEGQKNSPLYDANNLETLPDSLVRKEGAANPGDASEDIAYENSGQVYDFYYDICNRKSLDKNNMGLRSVVHYGHKIDNAFWGGNYMCFEVEVNS